jgi:hypothetical protein
LKTGYGLMPADASDPAPAPTGTGSRTPVRTIFKYAPALHAPPAAATMSPLQLKPPVFTGRAFGDDRRSEREPVLGRDASNRDVHGVAGGQRRRTVEGRLEALAVLLDRFALESKLGPERASLASACGRLAPARVRRSARR